MKYNLNAWIGLLPFFILGAMWGAVEGGIIMFLFVLTIWAVPFLYAVHDTQSSPKYQEMLKYEVELKQKEEERKNSPEYKEWCKRIEMREAQRLAFIRSLKSK